MRPLALVLVLAAVSGSLTACGSSQHKTGTTAAAQAQIKSAYEKFFSSKTSLSDRVALLENGPKFRSVIESFASNPLAKNVSAEVSSVTLEPGNKATVVYMIHVAGASLAKQTGTAVRQSGTWKVGAAGLCKLVALGGTTPSACKS